MCGRYTQLYTWAEVYAFLNLINQPMNLRPVYNVCPPGSAIRATSRMRARWAASFKRSRPTSSSGLMPIVLAIRSTGVITLEAMTQALNQRGIRSARGGKWHASSVMNLLARAQNFA